jgi:monovalent cation:H+ antiporter-2, CPA2 family
MHNIDLILTLTGGLAAALVLGYVTHRLGLSPIVGYLLAGIVVGPHTPGFIADQKMADQMAEVGVILLMFGVGLQFHWEELLAVRKVAVPGAIVQSLVATVLGLVVALAFGGDWRTGLVFGLALSVASTVVLVRVLTDNRDLHTPTGHIAVGWLVVEDLFTVMVLVLLPVTFGKSIDGSGELALALGLAMVKITVLVAFTFVVGGRLIPWLLEQVAATRSRELFTLTVLVVALGIAVGSTKVFGVSMALGAFLAGMVVGRSDFSLRAASEALPMRDAFAVLFFVSIGMLLDPLHIVDAPGLVLATLAVILLGKPLAALLIVRLLGYPVKTALSVAVALAQIGEFSFILATLGTSLGIFPPAANQTVVAAAIISITLNPLLYRWVDAMEAWASRRPRLWAWLNARVRQEVAEVVTAPTEEGGTESRHRAVVIGYGPVGQTVTRLLRDNDIEPTIIELNLDSVRRLRQEGLAAVYGDASHRDTLKNARVGEARSLILSASGMVGSKEVIRLARELNPDIQILARSAYVRELGPLRQAGAERVFAGEGEVALALTEAILHELGATPEQIDRERERVRADLYGDPLPVMAPEQYPVNTAVVDTSSPRMKPEDAALPKVTAITEEPTTPEVANDEG